MSHDTTETSKIEDDNYGERVVVAEKEQAANGAKCVDDGFNECGVG